ncbi:N-acetylglucosamine-6-phosphate deacetylase [Rhizosaccharibacter radicis]|uniref:N-acetylglucosamine-6-phosphate deacetylase n=1 Tax=Rhizosaccharibacter radicis TaxID=2782605 RepID=A0ABT1VTU8_9PROT|nr:N-acetylglucosamine-6-phosphate deacetylase [Acetobacteraceae bacterium KSS12]
MTTVLDGQIVLPDRVMPGRIRFGPFIETIDPLPSAPDRLVLPGFIDAHVHGGGGGDTIDGVDGIETLARFHLSHGTTTLLPTTITRPWPEVLAMLEAVRRVMESGVENGADIPGAHLEGPFISPQRLGAQPAFAVLPTPERVREALRTGAVRVVTMAPELEHAFEAAAAFVSAGVRVSLGHSQADHAQAAQMLDHLSALGGVAAGTHLFNAMNGIAGRSPGLVGALLLSPDAHAELILDTHHVHPASFRLAHAMLGDRLLLITDAMRAAGLGDGESELGGHPVSIRDGIARLRDGTLAGSVLTMDQAFRNALAAGMDIPAAARLTAGNAASYLGLADRGALRPGLRADLVVMDASTRIDEVWRLGRRSR